MFKELNDDCLFSIYKYLDHIELTRLTYVNRFAFQTVTSSSGSNHLWRFHLNTVFPLWKERGDLPSLEGDIGAQKGPRAKDDAGYKRFKDAIKLYGADIARSGCMNQLNAIVNGRLIPFLKAYAPHILQNLSARLTSAWFDGENEEGEFYRQFFLSLPGPLRALYYILGGQSAPVDETEGNGVFGSFYCYDLSPSCSFLELKQAVFLKTKCESYSDPLQPITRDIFPFASSLDARQGLPLTFGVDTNSKEARVYVFGLKGQPRSRQPILFANPACPKGTGLIEWLDNYVKKLEEGVFSMQERPEVYHRGTYHDKLKYICLHPYPSRLLDLESSINGSVKVTHGIKIIMGATMISLPDAKGLFSYRCWIYNDGSVFKSVQLSHRTWRIKSCRGKKIESVFGPGVIGLTPLITDCDESIFNYASQTQVSFEEPVDGDDDDESPYMEGSFRFVPGTLEAPVGEYFEALVGRVYFKPTEFIYT